MGRNYLIPVGTGARVKARRQELQLTQRKLGEMVSRHVEMRTGREKFYSDSWVRNIEHDKGSALLDAAIGLADALGVSMDWLFGRTVGADIVIEADEGAAAAEVKQQVVDAAVGPLSDLEPGSGTAEPIPLEPARRGRKRAGARPPRT